CRMRQCEVAVLARLLHSPQTQSCNIIYVINMIGLNTKLSVKAGTQFAPKLVQNFRCRGRHPLLCKFHISIQEFWEAHQQTPTSKIANLLRANSLGQANVDTMAPAHDPPAGACPCDGAPAGFPSEWEGLLCYGSTSSTSASKVFPLMVMAYFARFG